MGTCHISSVVTSNRQNACYRAIYHSESPDPSNTRNYLLVPVYLSRIQIVCLSRTDKDVCKDVQQISSHAMGLVVINLPVSALTSCLYLLVNVYDCLLVSKNDNSQFVQCVQ
jgi:hypothetical protein